MVVQVRAYTDLYTTDTGISRERERKNMEENKSVDLGLAKRDACRQDVDDLIFDGETGYISER